MSATLRRLMPYAAAALAAAVIGALLAPRPAMLSDEVRGDAALAERADELLEGRAGYDEVVLNA